MGGQFSKNQLISGVDVYYRQESIQWQQFANLKQFSTILKQFMEKTTHLNQGLRSAQDTKSIYRIQAG